MMNIFAKVFLSIDLTFFRTEINYLRTENMYSQKFVLQKCVDVMFIYDGNCPLIVNGVLGYLCTLLVKKHKDHFKMFGHCKMGIKTEYNDFKK